MGMEIEKQAQSLGIEISKKIDAQDDLASVSFATDEVAIEFTTPQACLHNIETLLTKNVPIVCGTTGWYDQKDLVKNMVEKHQGSFLYASNFSIGVHLFWQTLEFVSQKMNQHPSYSVASKEIHHIHKKDKPSGTAKSCEEILIKNIDRIDDVQTQSIREGEVFGDHQILFDSDVDTIEISHKAKSRAGFAKGAIACAQWIHGKKGFFTIEDYLGDRI